MLVEKELEERRKGLYLLQQLVPQKQPLVLFSGGKQMDRTVCVWSSVEEGEKIG